MLRVLSFLVWSFISTLYLQADSVRDLSTLRNRLNILRVIQKEVSSITQPALPTKLQIALQNAPSAVKSYVFVQGAYDPQDASIENMFIEAIQDAQAMGGINPESENSVATACKIFKAISQDNSTKALINARQTILFTKICAGVPGSGIPTAQAQLWSKLPNETGAEAIAIRIANGIGKNEQDICKILEKLPSEYRNTNTFAGKIICAGCPEACAPSGEAWF